MLQYTLNRRPSCCGSARLPGLAGGLEPQPRDWLSQEPLSQGVHRCGYLACRGTPSTVAPFPCFISLLTGRRLVPLAASTVSAVLHLTITRSRVQSLCRGRHQMQQGPLGHWPPLLTITSFHTLFFVFSSNRIMKSIPSPRTHRHTRHQRPVGANLWHSGIDASSVPFVYAALYSPYLLVFAGS